MPHKKHCVSSSSDDDDDDVPLKAIKQDLINNDHRKCDLYKRIKEKCEFGNEVFDNRYVSKKLRQFSSAPSFFILLAI